MCLPIRIASPLLLFLSAWVFDARAGEIPTVFVGNAGNAADPLTGRGKVAYDYNIGKYTITIAQYTEFLNAVAKRDRYRLYSPHKMNQIGKLVPSTVVKGPADNWSTGIARSGTAGNYVYSVIGSSENIPVTWTDWFDAARFCNWMHNGQPADPKIAEESTEIGAYTLKGDIKKGGQHRNPGAKWWIPSIDEWYKAAYYDPSLAGGVGGYWRYFTRSNEAPGNEIGDGANEMNAIANEKFAVKTTPGQHGVFNPVGAFSKSHSFFGCFDMEGNAAQWTDSIFPAPRTRAKTRPTVGGSPNTFTVYLQSTSYANAHLGGFHEGWDNWDTGFRVATVAKADVGDN